MAREDFTDSELLAYLDESLAVGEMAAVEAALRQNPALRQRVALLSARRDHGVHSVGDVWRRARLSCPPRHQLGSYLLGAADPAWVDYFEFHLRVVGCRFCAANLDDLRQTIETTPEVERRRRKFFESSAGYIRKLAD